MELEKGAIKFQLNERCFYEPVYNEQAARKFVHACCGVYVGECRESSSGVRGVFTKSGTVCHEASSHDRPLQNDSVQWYVFFFTIPFRVFQLMKYMNGFMNSYRYRKNR